MCGVVYIYISNITAKRMKGRETRICDGNTLPQHITLLVFADIESILNQLIGPDD